MKEETVEVIECVATKIKYQDKTWIPEGSKTSDTNSLSAEKIKCWIRFKNISEFCFDDIREVFPEWSRYAKSQLVYKVKDLILDKYIIQLGNDSFKVVK